MPKYTDEQIKKMLGTIIKQNEHKVLNGIPNNICCLNMELTKAMRDLINRQEAEIERLSAENEQLGNDVDGKMKYIYELEERIKTAKSEAIKEFAERLKKSAFDCDVSFGFGREHYTEAVTVFEIDNLVKEMVGENNA